MRHAGGKPRHYPGWQSGASSPTLGMQRLSAVNAGSSPAPGTMTKTKECEECEGEGILSNLLCSWSCDMCGACIEDVTCYECEGTGEIEREDEDEE